MDPFTFDFIEFGKDFTFLTTNPDGKNFRTLILALEEKHGIVSIAEWHYIRYLAATLKAIPLKWANPKATVKFASKINTKGYTKCLDTLIERAHDAKYNYRSCLHYP